MGVLLSGAASACCPGLIGDHRHHSARARSERRGQTVHITYSGVITGPSLAMLERRLLPDRRSASASFERMDGALTLFRRAGDYIVDEWRPPSAVIVRDDQMDGADDANRLLARRGVIRTAWLPECASEALAWLALMQSKRL